LVMYLVQNLRLLVIKRRTEFQTLLVLEQVRRFVDALLVRQRPRGERLELLGPMI